MSSNIYDYRIERARDSHNWYKLTVYEESGDIDYCMKATGQIIVRDGRITSINGNGCLRSDFRSLRIKLFRNNIFQGTNETEVLRALEEIVCSKKT